jgi:uncharacterized membrane protein YagU involved in acid resistance
LVRDGVVAGLVATTVMNASYWAERRIRRNVEGPLDYDDSNVPAQVAARLLRPVVRNTELSDQASRWLGFAVHWGYGSLFGVSAVPLNRRFGPAAATAVYWSGMMAMACAMFPVLGGTPPPWRWRRDVIVTSAFQHLVYAATATATLRLLTRAQRDAGRATPQELALAGGDAHETVAAAGGVA